MTLRPSADRERPARKRRPLTIGLTGPIGCGKSTVAGWLADAGAAVIDADEVARGVTAPGSPLHDVILEAFGPAVVAGDGTLDRAALARIVFSQPRRLAQLERIVHPAVRDAILACLREAEELSADVVVVEAIRLVEGGLADLCDEVWLIRCPGGVQRRRLQRRGHDEADAERRIAAQQHLEAAARARATRIISTGGSLRRTHERVLAAYGDALEAIAAARGSST